MIADIINYGLPSNIPKVLMPYDDRNRSLQLTKVGETMGQIRQINLPSWSNFRTYISIMGPDVAYKRD